MGGLGGQKTEENGNMRQREKGWAKSQALGLAASVAPPWKDRGQTELQTEDRQDTEGILADLQFLLSSGAVVGRRWRAGPSWLLDSGGCLAKEGS